MERKNGVHIDVFLSLTSGSIPADEYHVQGANFAQGILLFGRLELKLRRWLKGVAILKAASRFDLSAHMKGVNITWTTGLSKRDGIQLKSMFANSGDTQSVLVLSTSTN